jgi:hypothetical protein
MVCRHEAHFRIGYKVLNSRPSTTESYLAWIECHEEVNIQSFVITMYTQIDTEMGGLGKPKTHQQVNQLGSSQCLWVKLTHMRGMTTSPIKGEN